MDRKALSDQLGKLQHLMEKAYLGKVCLVPVPNPDIIINSYAEFEILGMLPDEIIKGKVIQFTGPMIPFMSFIWQTFTYQSN